MDLTYIMKDVEYEIIQHGDTAEITSITIDSRKIEKGSLFICMQGLTVDGHQFINDAAAKGAAVVVIEKEQTAYPKGLMICKVDYARKSLSAIAANFYGQPGKNLRLFGVTGTNGKTSTAYMMESILKQVGKPGLIGTVGLRLNGSKLDIPFSTSTTPDPQDLQRIFSHMLKGGCRDVAMEVSSHALALYKMEGLNFEVGIFTNLTQDHLDFHGTMENYLDAKAKLFRQCRFGVVNADSKYAENIMELGTCEKWFSYGIDSNCDIRAIHIKDLADGSSFDIKLGDILENFYLPVKGRFNVYNALAAISAAFAAGIDIKYIRAGLANFEGVPGRIQSVPNDKGFHVLVDYAHTPDGLINIINAVRAFTKGQVITLFGCGGNKDTGKRPIMGRIAGELSDYCIVTSDNPRSEPPEDIIKQIVEGISETNCRYDAIADRKQAIFNGIKMLNPGDALIIAGKGHENYQIVGDKTLPFDDVEVASKALCN